MKRSPLLLQGKATLVVESLLLLLQLVEAQVAQMGGVDAHEVLLPRGGLVHEAEDDVDAKGDSGAGQQGVWQPLVQPLRVHGEVMHKEAKREREE